MFLQRKSFQNQNNRFKYQFLTQWPMEITVDLMPDIELIRAHSKAIHEQGEAAAEKHRVIFRRMEDIITGNVSPHAFLSSSPVSCICTLCNHRHIRKFDEVYIAFLNDARAYIHAACIEKYKQILWVQQPLKASLYHISQ